jgi:hypothetical protein
MSPDREIVAKQMDRPECLEGFLSQRFDVFGLRNVGPHRQHRRAGGSDLSFGFRERFRFHIGQNNFHP